MVGSAASIRAVLVMMFGSFLSCGTFEVNSDEDALVLKVHFVDLQLCQ